MVFLHRSFDISDMKKFEVYNITSISCFVKNKEWRRCSLPTVSNTLFKVEHVLQGRPDSFYDSDSIRNSMGSFRDSAGSNRDSVGDHDWEEYNAQLQEVLQWLSKAESKLRSQPAVSLNVDVVKDQFHEHEVSY